MTEEFRKRTRNLLLLDIETVAAFGAYEQLPERMQKLWDKKASVLKRGDDSLSHAEYFYDRGAIYAEFGKIVCIAFGAFYWNEKDEMSFKVSSFSGDDEVYFYLYRAVSLDRHLACGNNQKHFARTTFTGQCAGCFLVYIFNQGI